MRVEKPSVPPAKGAFSIRARANSFVYAFRGVRALLWREHNAWLHLLAAVAAVGLGWWFQIARVEWCLVAFAVGSVLAAEAFNTAVEALADALHPEQNALVGHAKDLAAAGVLLAAGGAAVVGLLIFGPRVAETLSVWTGRTP